MINERFRLLARDLSARVDGVPADRWDDPAPCAGWVARDVIDHLVGWVPGPFLGGIGVPVPEIPSVATDPAGAWHAVAAAMQAALDDPALATTPLAFGPGTFPFEQAVAQFVLADILIHTWDLARATGQDETLDADEVRGFLVAMEPMDAAIRGEHFGPRVPVADDADDQTKLIAFTGRTP
jgi:uncharacterized protein (TIGR03086 family)